MNSEVYDIAGIGIGPFNLSLACMSDPLSEISTIFFDQKPEFDWHSGIMPAWSTLQIPFFADLVTFADPTSKFSFVNYLKSQGRIYQFYIRQSFFILRTEYNDYCKWAAEQLDNLYFGHRVEKVSYDETSKIYTLTVRNSDNQLSNVRAKHLVLGTGTTPVIPEFCQPVKQQVHMSADYLSHKPAYKDKKSITIIGSGQSGAEIYYDLLSEIDQHQYQLNWVTRSERFFAMDLSKLSLELTSPDYTQHFYGLSPHKRDQFIDRQAMLYKGINASLIDQIYDMLYIKSRQPHVKTRLLADTQLNEIKHQDHIFTLSCTKQDLAQDFKIESEVVILSLGYEYKIPGCLYPIAHHLHWDDKERLLPSRDFTINADKTVYVQNVGLYTHGISAADLGMGCYRNSIIINQIMGKQIYVVEEKICFQEFSPQ